MNLALEMRPLIAQPSDQTKAQVDTYTHPKDRLGLLGEIVVLDDLDDLLAPREEVRVALEDVEVLEARLVDLVDLALYLVAHAGHVVEEGDALHGRLH